MTIYIYIYINFKNKDDIFRKIFLKCQYQIIPIQIQSLYTYV